ncbi:hypothetical protein EV127DRAFT_430922 [Xylaria flabelliformis]|nr:hypothetical protein EV127DRAFT_430922 [Xylaria flabelliformis]
MGIVRILWRSHWASGSTSWFVVGMHAMGSKHERQSSKVSWGCHRRRLLGMTSRISSPYPRGSFPSHVAPQVIHVSPFSTNPTMEVLE